MFKNTLGHKTIFSVLLAISWMLIVIDTWQITALLAAILLVLVALFVPIMTFHTEGLQVYSINPFTRRGLILYSNITRAEIHAGNVHCKLILHLHDREQTTLHFLLKDYEMEDLYNHLTQKQVAVSSTGVRTTGWKS